MSDPIPKQVSCYDGDYYYICNENAIWSPLDKEKGIFKEIKPANSTFKLVGEIPEGKRAKYNLSDDSWIFEDLPPNNYIEITTSKKLCPYNFKNTLLKEISTIICPDNALLIQDISRVLRFDDVSDTTENRAVIQTVIDEHDYTEASRQVIKDVCSYSLSSLEWLRTRYNDQKELITAGQTLKNKITEEQYIEMLVYFQELRDFADICDVDNPVYPVIPGWMKKYKQSDS